MNYLGTCAIQYANNLFQSKKIVLRADRDRGDNPYAEIYSIEENSKLLLKINNDIKIEGMESNPSAGNKVRTDIYFSYANLDDLIKLLEPFINSLNINFNDTPNSTPNPTGMEHSSGLRLGKIFNQYGTKINVECIAQYGEKKFMIFTNSNMFIDPELKRGKKLHMGITMSEIIQNSIGNNNCFEIYIKYIDLKIFLYSIKIAKKMLSQN